MIPVLKNGADSAPFRLLLTHGAGAGMTHPVMEHLALGLADGQLQVIRFEFPFMQQIRTTGRRRPPDRAPKLMDYWRTVATEFAHPRLYLAGKSLGGRMASLVADELSPQGLILLGFPFVPPANPQQYRGDHLATLATPTLLLQGERDRFGNKEQVANYALSSQITTRWVPDGCHDFKPRKSSGTSHEANLDLMVAAMKEFIIND